MLGLIISTAVGVAILLGQKKIKGTFKKSQIFLFGTAGAVIIVGFLVLATVGPSMRLAVFHSSPGDAHLFEGSTINHFKATSEGIDRVIANPVGCGLGCAGPASYYSDYPRISENYYVQIAEEVGLLGLVVWLFVFLGVMKSLLGIYRRQDSSIALVLFASGVGLAVIGMLLHVWADDPLSLTWWGLAGYVIGQYKLADGRR